MKKIFFLAYLLGITAISSSQVAEQWFKTYQMNCDLTSLQGFGDMELDDNDNIFVGGWTCQGSRNSDFSLIKYLPNGDTAWVRRWVDPNRNVNEIGRGVALDNAGNIYITGRSASTGTGNDVTTLKYDQQGNIIWVRKVSFIPNGPTVEEAYDIAIDTADNIYVTGYAANDAFLIKYNTAGDTLWTRKYQYNNLRSEARTVKTDLRGNVYMSGFGRSAQSTVFYINKYSTDGTLLWSNRMDNCQWEYDVKMLFVVDDNGNVYQTGKRSGTGVGHEIRLIKYDSTGAVKWSNAYNYDSFMDDDAYGITLDTDGNPVIIGASDCDSTNFDLVTIKYTADGDTLWTRRVTDNQIQNNDVGLAVVTDGQNNIYVTGEVVLTGMGREVMTIKYSPSGQELWRIRSGWTNSGLQYNAGILLDSHNDVIISGNVNSFVSYTKATLTAKISQVTGVTPIVGEVPESFSLSQNYPNPFNPETTIKFELPKDASGLVTLIVYDNLGREVETLVSSEMKVGAYSVSWDASKYSSGVYFYKITAANFSQTRKMVLIK